MSIKVQIKGVERLTKRLLQQKKLSQSAKYEVGFSDPKAIFVHEMPNTVNWTTPGTGNKYLERPARQMKPQIKKMVRDHLKSGMSLDQAMKANALILENNSLKVTPKDTGDLRSTSFVRKAN